MYKILWRILHLENPIELGEIIEASIVVQDTIKDNTPRRDSNEDSTSFLEHENPYDLITMESDIHKYTSPMGYNFPYVENTETQDLYLKRKTQRTCPENVGNTKGWKICGNFNEKR